ncbi:MAG TPA: hypothetical protein VFO18_19610 [Methylomirabilota bacterium]|nr:hypothetical protein [Methylomirabilota bacterium]
MNRNALIRWSAVALVAAFLFSSVAPALAQSDDALIPFEKYTTPKAKTLATTYKARLIQFYEQIYNCMPWVSVVKNGIGFPRRKGDDTDFRYLSVWIQVDQQDDGSFGALPQDRRVSAMFSRYGVDMLRRLTALTDVASDANLDGFSVVLSWLKPGTGNKPGVQPVNETLALFVDKATLQEFLAKRLPAAEFTNRAKFSVFDGQDAVGRVPLEVWEDSFNSSYKVQNYEPPKGQKC